MKIFKSRFAKKPMLISSSIGDEQQHYDKVQLIQIYGYQNTCPFMAQTYLKSTLPREYYLYDYQENGVYSFDPSPQVLGPIYQISDLKSSPQDTDHIHIYPLLQSTYHELDPHSQVTLSFLKKYFQNYNLKLYNQKTGENVDLENENSIIWKMDLNTNYFINVSYMFEYQFNAQPTFGLKKVMKLDRNDSSPSYPNVYAMINGSPYHLFLYTDKSCPELNVTTEEMSITQNLLKELKSNVSGLKDFQFVYNQGIQIPL